MAATVASTVPCPNRWVDIDEVVVLLRSHGVSEGIRLDAIRDFLVEWRTQGPCVRAVVARGVEPVIGSISGIRRLPPPPRSGRRAVELLPLYVAEGEPMFAVDRESPSSPGLSVTSLKVEARDVHRSVQPGEGIVDAGDVWRAAHSGFLVQDDHKIRVARDLLHRHDLPAGDYHWEGGARIDGNLRAGARLRVFGALWVGGNVEDGVTIAAAGDVHIEGDVKGADTSIQARGQVTVGAISRSRICSEGRITIQRWCRDAWCRTYDRFQSGAHGCQVIGGRIEAVLGARLYDVGSADKVPTRITVGTADWVHEENAAINAEAGTLARRLQTLQNEFRVRFADWMDPHVDSSRFTPAERSAFQAAQKKLAMETTRSERDMASLRSRQRHLAEMRAGSGAAAVVVEGRAHSGTVFVVRRRTLVVGPDGLNEAAVILSPKRDRVLAVPKFIFEASQEESFASPETAEPAH